MDPGRGEYFRGLRELAGWRGPALRPLPRAGGRSGGAVRSASALVLAGLLTLLLGSSTLAAKNKLNSPLATGGSVVDFAISPDGRYTVYMADQQADEVYEIFSVPTTGGVPQRLNGDLPLNGDVEFFRISPDGRYVVYTADQQVDTMLEIFSVPIAGGVPQRLNLSLQPDGDVDESFRLSPDGSQVIYLADWRIDEVYELYSVPIGGPADASVPLNPPLKVGETVSNQYDISPDGSRVVYLTTVQPNETPILYTVPIGGPASASTQLNTPLDPGGDIHYFTFSPDSLRVIYIARQNAVNMELYSVPMTGPANAGVKLNLDLVPRGDVTDFIISPDSRRVVYLADWRADERFEALSVPIDGPAIAAVGLKSPLPVGSVDRFKASEDGSRVVFRVTREADKGHELLSTPLAGGVNTPVYGAGEALNIPYFQISSDGSRVVAPVGPQGGKQTRIVSVPIDGPASARVELFPPPGVADEVDFFYISPDSKRVVYIVTRQGGQDIYSVPIDGPASARVRLNGPMVAGGGFDWFEFVPGNDWVMYTADQEVDGRYELFVADDGRQQVSFATESLEVGEGAGSVRVEVRLSQPVVKDVTVWYVLTGGSARLGTDYTLVGESVTLASGTTAQTFDIPIIDDGLREGAETLELTLSGPTNAARGEPSRITITIADDDPPTAPAEPTAPTEPTDPTAQAEPTAPTAPTTPPAEPTAPSAPTTPPAPTPAGQRIHLPFLRR